MHAKHKIQQKFKYRSPSTYFGHFTEPNGLNADVARHDAAIASLCKALENPDVSSAAANVYRYYLRLCMDSRAKLTDLL